MNWLHAAALVTLMAATPGAPVVSDGAPAAAPEPSPVLVHADDAFPKPKHIPPADLFALAQVTPIFTTGPLGEAKAAYDSGLHEKAVALFNAAGQIAPLPTGARYLRAIASLKTGRSDEAIGELLEIARIDGALASRCHAAIAVALEEADKPAAAAAQYALVELASPLHRDAALGLARMLAKTGDLDAARLALEALANLPAPSTGSGRDYGAEALWERATFWARLGRVHQSQLDYRRIYLAHPMSPLAEDARTRSAGLPSLSVQELVDRAELLLNANHNQAALAELDPLAHRVPLPREAPDELACRIHFDHGKTLRKMRRHPEAVAALQPVADRCLSSAEEGLRVKALYLLGQSETVTDPVRAEKVYVSLAEQFPKHSFADDALYLAADLALKNPDGKSRAQALFQQLLATYPGGDFAPEALFRLFWMARSDGDGRSGVPYLAALEISGAAASASEGRLRAAEPTLRARYWEAVTLGDRDGLKTLAEDEPRSYYGRLALAALPEAERPKIGSSPGVDATTLSLRAGPLIDDPNFRTAVELLRMGLPAEAAEELERIDHAGLGAAHGGEPLLLLAVCLQAAGDSRSAHAIAKGMLDGGSGSNAASLAPILQRLVWQVAYPNAYRDVITRWAKVYGVPPDLMQALMREESALDPLVLSAAGAVGLTQLMPATASRLAHKLGLGPMGAVALQNPDINIRLGTAYLGELLARYGGREALAVAAYNAGEGAVDRWLQLREGEPLDVFVEDIPVAETRNYVKRVLTSEATYHALYGEAAPVAAR
jgi:soluble lytic murein transglycosylase